MTKFLKRLTARLSPPWQYELKRLYYALQIRRTRFQSEEREYRLLESLLSPGDWVIDIGANVGYYTLRLSAIVGEQGRVIAVEPTPTTFALLASNVMHSGAQNVTLLNVGASDTPSVVGMEMPRFDTGLANYYQAHVTEGLGEWRVVCLPLDALELPSRVSLVKVDAEGHELKVLQGMAGLLSRDRPTLIVETDSASVLEFIGGFGYRGIQEPGSPNWIFTYGDSP